LAVKPVRLYLQGFTAFHKPVTVDFADRKLFAITGPTGAGKSSLLDAMIWALFGKVPRVGNQVGSLISHGANLARVQLEFEARGRRYRIARVRPVSGTTTARLERLDPSGDAEPLADRVSEVNTAIEALLGINYDTFVKTIILPQGEFSAFLSGDPKEKKDVLKKLLGLEVYTAMMQAANSRASGAKSAAGLLQQQYEQIEYRSAEALAPLEAHVRATEQEQEQLTAHQARLKRLEAAAAEYALRAKEADAARLAAAEAAARAREAARAAEQAGKALAAAAAARDMLSKEIAALDYDAEAHDLARKQLAAAEQLATARAHLDAAERATAEARAVEERATAEAEQHHHTAAEAHAALHAARDALQAVVAPAAATVIWLEEEARSAERDRAAAERKSHEYELRAKQLQHLAGAAITLRRDLEAADAKVQRATAAAATAEADRLQAQATEASAAVKLEAAEQYLEASRLQDTAAAILATLEVGDPCPVCGEPITEFKLHAAPDLAAAQRALDAARKTHTKAQSVHQLASNEAAAAHARVEAARTAFAAIEAKQAALDEELVAAAATRATVDRAAKRASTAAASEHEQAVQAQRRAAASAQAAGVLRVLLVKLPPDLASDEVELAQPADDIESLAAGLGAAIEDYAAASQCADTAAAAVKEAEARVATAAAEVNTAVALQQHQATVVATATQALVVLRGPADVSLPALRSAIETMDALAARAAELAAKRANAEQQHAAASAVLHERAGACEAATAAVAHADAYASTATDAAEDAQAAFEAEWRGLLPAHDPDLAVVPELLDAAAGKANALAAELGHARATLEAARADVARAEQLRDEAEGYRRDSEVASSLGLELQSNRFVAFIQREAMHALAADASERMLQLSRDRYRLEADGDEFVVVDRLNGDERRSVRTLSGGETFLASLALALALSERLPELSGRGGALSLESLFLDEGFGSLDAESLDVAIQGLELLASGDRMIGVISHVSEVAERLPDRIEVVKTGGTSAVRDAS
jgi:exonuclease SbcC